MPTSRSAIDELAQKIATICGAPEPAVVPKFRDGDVRAARCDIEPAKSELDWRPRWSLEDGLLALLGWIGEQAELAVEPSDHAHACHSEVEQGLPLKDHARLPEVVAQLPGIAAPTNGDILTGAAATQRRL